MHKIKDSDLEIELEMGRPSNYSVDVERAGMIIKGLCQDQYTSEETATIGDKGFIKTIQKEKIILDERGIY